MSFYAGRAKYDSSSIDYQTTHIPKAPYQSVVIPRSERVNENDVSNRINQTIEYTRDSFNNIPWDMNAGQAMASGPINVWNSRNIPNKRTHANQPRFHPEGGWQISWDAKLPEDYYAQNRKGIRYVDLPSQIEHSTTALINHPLVGKFQLAEKTLVPIVPSAVYEIGRPEVGLNRPLVYKGNVSLSNFDTNLESIPVQALTRPLVYKGNVSLAGYDTNVQSESVNPHQVSTFIHNKNILNILPPVYGTYIKVFDKKIPIKFKNPNHVVLQASDSEAIDIPLPDGKSVKLKEYQWILVQNVDSEAELIFEIPTHLKDRPDLTFSLSQISSAYENDVEFHHQKLNENRICVGKEAPVVDQLLNQYIDQSSVGQLTNSRSYYSLDNTFDALPSNLAPTKLMKFKDKMKVETEVAVTAPWHF